MKFTAKSWDEIKIERRRVKIEKLSKWHRKFAWTPARIKGDDFVWMEFVLRKGKIRYLTGSKIKWLWEYKESVFDLLKTEKNS